MRVPGVRFVQGRNRYGTSTKYAIAVHATANTASAADEAMYATRRTDGTSAHFYLDRREVIQSLDTRDRAGHAGSTQGNTYAIALEFTGLNSWSRATWLSSVAWDRVGAVLATVSRTHQIPARRVTVAQMRADARVRGAYDHNQMRLAWGGTDHTDPGPHFPWDRLLAVWQQHLQGEDFPVDQSQFESMFLRALRQGGAIRRAIGVAPHEQSVYRTGQSAHFWWFSKIPDSLAEINRKLDILAGSAGGAVARQVGAISSETRTPRVPAARTPAESTGDADVVARLGSPDVTVAQKAALLREWLGQDAPAVGAALAAGPARSA
ncbi:N-acetylmuramoyl-L-alanine amidase [Micromonospora pattaloongensis]|uniref:N-acetylmuramoyl-L-alanine amidase n=1 Tax=Micromonospora pattaloongensis TaxID=405436 RepID=A0A1H3SQU2_9ACTN|nr:peptidoglycan recognition family protein [Micromonospora pattaloongensis]SDZ39921.1 N-acetylmuramoyl-L-alanine amidase [Micromonospora pattaloongensis]